MGGGVVLDTTVLVARPIHQLLGTLGVAGSLRIMWSEELLDELVAVLARPTKDGGRGWSTGAARAAAGYMRTAFSENEVTAAAMAASQNDAHGLVRDRGDAHVVALALASPAETIVTANTRDFRITALKARGTRVVTPDRLLLEMYAEIPDDVVGAIEDQVVGRARYPVTVHDILSLLFRAGCVEFGGRLCVDLGLPPPEPAAVGAEPR